MFFIIGSNVQFYLEQGFKSLTLVSSFYTHFKMFNIKDVVCRDEMRNFQLFLNSTDTVKAVQSGYAQASATGHYIRLISVLVDCRIFF